MLSCRKMNTNFTSGEQRLCKLCISLSWRSPSWPPIDNFLNALWFTGISFTAHFSYKIPELQQLKLFTFLNVHKYLCKSTGQSLCEFKKQWKTLGNKHDISCGVREDANLKQNKLSNIWGTSKTKTIILL